MSTDIMSNRHNGEQTKCRTDKMLTDKMPNRQNVDKKNHQRSPGYAWCMEQARISGMKYCERFKLNCVEE